ncbi:helix-turn-helix domain-containing protein [Clostridium tyrobutyricum]|uniref:helix-turn-helix domain-containing protein n=1 Tax=Clostridium tyrobutyricum TaxID=1519 RepID=UPI001C380D47|nr:helix-turn-helix domain-containing protein [Clostridium tyrobutyricum]MBV4431517.1 helix-turn-helix domain-containing protein [Clostridium tyrobutyricum]
MAVKISTILKELRYKKDIKQEDVAKAIGISKSGYGYYEQGRSMPDPEMLLKLAKYFKVSVDYLLGNSDNKNTPNSDITPAEKISKLVKDNKIETLAAHFDGEDLTDDDVEDIKKFIEFVVQKRKNKNK